MASKLPICIYSGLLKELVAGDTLAVPLLDVTGATPIARVYSTTNDAVFSINRPNSKAGRLLYATAGATRWEFTSNNTTETGSGNVGSDFACYAYSDAGVATAAYTIDRATASMALANNPTAPTQASTDNSTRIATTAWAKFGFAILLAINGYIKFPSWLGGLIIQWGAVTSPGTGGTTFNFPMTFPTAALRAWGSNATSSTSGITVFVGTPTTTGVGVATSTASVVVVVLAVGN